MNDHPLRLNQQHDLKERPDSTSSPTAIIVGYFFYNAPRCRHPGRYFPGESGEARKNHGNHEWRIHGNRERADDIPF